ncbi:hypothetical protein, partial [Thiolapillus sp.]
MKLKNKRQQNAGAGQQEVPITSIFVTSVKARAVDPGLRRVINLATKNVVFSRSHRRFGKASERRCSHSTASFDNAVRSVGESDLSFDINALAHLSIPLTIIFAKTDRYGFQRTSYGTTDLISWLRLGFRRG